MISPDWSGSRGRRSQKSKTLVVERGRIKVGMIGLKEAPKDAKDPKRRNKCEEKPPQSTQTLHSTHSTQ